MLFKDLNVRPEIVKALIELSIKEPTLIQEKAIPLALEGKDIIGISETGSGKTLAFGVPVIEAITPKAGLQALIVAPTRELAVQIAQELMKFSKYLKVNITTVFGGVAIGPQMERIARADIVVGTPGRLLDHLQRGTIDFSRIKCAVLDEADKMVEMGFVEDIQLLFDKMPKEKQMFLFGATIKGEIDRIKKKYMHDPVIAKAEEKVKAELLKQYFYNVAQHEKFSLLVHLLQKEETDRVIVFCSTRRTVEIVSKNLRTQGIRNEMMHGKLTQNRRLKVIEDFNKGKIDLLVASSVAARGLHIDDVSHVFNYDLSQDSEEYVHRIGRTARAGESGKAITLLAPKDHATFNDILRFHDVKIEELPRVDFKRVAFQARGHEEEGRGGRFGSRGPRRGGFRGGPSRGGPRSRGGPQVGGFGSRSDGPRTGGFRSGPRGHDGPSGGPQQHHGSKDRDVPWGL